MAGILKKDQRNTDPYACQSNKPLPESQWFLKDHQQQQCQEYLDSL
jgi:hypothetical protein